jgi:hypothetical protein
VGTFTDVPLAHPYFNHIALMKSGSVTSGGGATAYCPDDSTTRSQMAVFIIRLLSGGDNFTYTTTPTFSDVPAMHPHFKWVQKMKELGITSGCTATTHCPDAAVTRGQMAVFITRAPRWESPPRTSSPTASASPTFPRRTPASISFRRWPSAELRRDARPPAIVRETRPRVGKWRFS